MHPRGQSTQTGLHYRHSCLPPRSSCRISLPSSTPPTACSKSGRRFLSHTHFLDFSPLHGLPCRHITCPYSAPPSICSLTLVSAHACFHIASLIPCSPPFYRPARRVRTGPARHAVGFPHPVRTTASPAESTGHPMAGASRTTINSTRTLNGWDERPWGRRRLYSSILPLLRARIGPGARHLVKPLRSRRRRLLAAATTTTNSRCHCQLPPAHHPMSGESMTCHGAGLMAGRCFDQVCHLSRPARCSRGS
jgi:hypothetical protein